ncbi:MAG: hypothetical protein IPK22_08895 [Verrucomicrobiaceae bacterium]|nr:hypothetical protein [Verrucomicrobiaceae bacterium]
MPKTSRRRRTDAVLSDSEAFQPWWRDDALSPMRMARPKHLRFRSGDPFDRFAALRYLVIAFSIITPAVILLTSDFTPGLVHHEWQADPMAEVRRCLVEGHSRSGIASLKAAIETSPRDAKLLRALAALVADAAPAEARRAYHKLNSLGLATPADSAGHAALLARLHDFTGAKAILSNLPKEAQSIPQAQFAWLAVWREAGDFTAAATALEKLLESSPDEASLAVDLLRRASNAPADTRHRIEASLVRSLAHMMNAGRAQDVLAMAPMLTGLPVSHNVHRMHLGQILRNLPGQSVEHRLAAVRFGHPVELPSTDEVQLRSDYQNEIAWSGGLSAEEKDRVAAWLQGQSEHRMVIALISAREAVTEPQLFARRFESLLEEGLWREAGAMVADPESPPLPHSRILAQTLATLHQRASRQFAVEMLLSEAITATREENRPLDCFAVGVAALDHHLPTLAATAFATALDISKDRSKTMRAILRSARPGRLPLNTFLRSLIGSPAMHDESIQEQLIYLSLLADQKTESMLAIVRNRRQLEPQNVYLRFLEALALHKTGASAGEAASLLVPLPRHRWHQGEAAVIASILASSGQIDRSAPLAAQIDPNQLLTEERALFSPWQSRFSMNADPLVGSVGSE